MPLAHGHQGIKSTNYKLESIPILNTAILLVGWVALISVET